MSYLPQAVLPVPEFADEGQASNWMYEHLDEDCIDNYRFAFTDDYAVTVQYAQIKSDGCCGFFDREVKVGGRLATIGCNYGH